MSGTQRERDIEAVAITIYGEARGESYQGKQAVGAVIQNRHYGGIPYLKGNTLAETASKKHQFAGYSDTIARGNIQRESSAWRDCVGVARQVVDHQCPDPTGGMTHFDTVNTPSVQRFEIGRRNGTFQGRVIIGNHEFTREVTGGSSRHGGTIPKAAHNAPQPSAQAPNRAPMPKAPMHKRAPTPKRDSRPHTPHPRSHPAPKPQTSTVTPFVGYSSHGFQVGIRVNCTLQ